MKKNNLIFYGESTAYEEINIQGEQTGKIIFLKYKLGDLVQKNENIAILDTKKLYLQLDKARLEQRSALEDIKDASLNLKTAKISFDRTRNLFERNAASKEALETSRVAFDASKSSLRKAKENLKQAQIALKLLEEQKKECRFVSPISGIINKKFYNLNEIYRSGDTLYHVINIDRIYINVQIPENAIAMIKPKMKVKILFSALKTEYFGVIEKIPPASNENKYSYTVQVLVDNPSHNIKSGMFAKVIFHDEESKKPKQKKGKKKKRKK